LLWFINSVNLMQVIHVQLIGFGYQVFLFK